jgi:anti-sigma factor RsiW
MMAPGPTDIDNDALLVAYLDGELEPEVHQELERRLRIDASLSARLAALAEASRPLRQAFDVLLEAAPRERLEAAFAAALAKAPRRRDYRYHQMLVAAAAALLLLVCGGVAGYFVAKAPIELFEETDTFEEEWIAAVAGQLSLYDAASVASIQVDDAEQKAQLSKLGDVLSLDLSAPKVALEGLTLKRAELLHFQGRKVVELLYASEEHGPVALCIAAEPGGEGEGEVESRNGLNFMYWASGGRRFLLIGAAPAKRIDALADTIDARFHS